jgi:protein SCO1/2
VPAFNPRFVGLYTDPAGTRALAGEFKAVYQKTAVNGQNDYLIDHSAGTYVYDTQGKIRLLVAYGTGPEAIAHDIRELLRGG